MFSIEASEPAGPRPIKDRYIVRVKTDQVSSVAFAAHEIANRFHGKVLRVWEAVSSFELQIDAAKAAQISEVSFVEFIEHDQEMDPPALVNLTDLETPWLPAAAPEAGSSANVRGITPNFVSACPTAQTSIPTGDGQLKWGLDRVDQRVGTDGRYYHGRNNGAGVDLYVIGTGIFEAHADFQQPNGTGSRITEWHSVVNDGQGIRDCESFGTKMASFSAGRYAGIAKGANIIPVKTWGCNPNGTAAQRRISDDVAGLNWIKSRPRPRPVIVLASHWWDDNASLKTAARDLVNAGLFVVAPAGHDSILHDTLPPTNCRSKNFSPGNATGVFTVGASREDDVNSQISCMGAEIAMFAPGERVKGATVHGDWNGQPGSSGTPYAAGYVAGAAAVAAQWLKQQNPNPSYIPRGADIRAALETSATKNKLALNGPNASITRNYLLYTRDFEENFPITCQNPPDGPACPIDGIEPRGGYFAGTGGTIRVDVTADASCTWSAAVNQAARNWLQVRHCSQDELGVVVSAGDSALCVEIGANPPPFNPGNPDEASAPRHGTIAINDKIFTVNQAGAKPPLCPIDSQGDPTFNIEGPSSVQRGQSIPLLAYAGEGFTYEWRASQSGSIIHNSPSMYLRSTSSLYPQGTSPVTYYCTVKSSRCLEGVTVSHTVSVHGEEATCELPFRLGPGIVAAPSPSSEVRIGAYRHPFDFQPEPAYQWYRGASGDESDPLTGKTTNEISVPARHGDMYWVKMTNGCGVELSGTGLIVTYHPPPQPKRRAARHSVTTIGNTDIMLRNPVTGENFVKAFSGATVAQTVQLPSFTPGWQAQLFSDLNADDRTDIVWRHPATGQNAYWRMSGTSVLSTIQFDSHDPAWQLGASADFDNDGNMDLIWQSKNTNDLQLWFMNREDHIGSFGLGRLPSGDWKLQGTADFDSDGKPDLMFRNYRTGSNAIWHMNDTIPPGFEDVSQNSHTVSTLSLEGQSAGDAMPGTIIEGLGPNWRVANIDDADGDGHPDIMWIDASTGEMMYWQMSGTQKINTVAMPPQSDSNLEIAGTPPADIPPAPAPTTLSVTATPATFGDVTTLTASLSAASGPLVAKSIAFKINGNSVGLAFTGDDGTAIVVASLDPLPVGSYTVAATFAGDATDGASSASTTLTVSPPQVQLTWSSPDPIAYGTSLSNAQLNAIADAAGTFVYTPSAGTVLPAGEQTLSVIFTPADQVTYGVSTASVQLTVTKGTPSVTWFPPLSIVFGTPLSATQLNATSTVAGTFAYDPAAGTILNAGNEQHLHVTFTPSDPNYDQATAEALIDVRKATQAIAWSNPTAIVFGTALSALQLNATVSVDGPSPAGTFTYAPAAGTIPQAGTETLTVTASGTPNYEPASKSVSLEVLQAKPVIAWAQPASIIYNTLLGSAQLNATANVAGSFAYTPAAGTKLTAGTHTLSVLFTPSDARNYENASATIALAVERDTPVLTWASPVSIIYGAPLSATELNATASVAGIFTYTPDSGTILNAGASQPLTVELTPADTYNYNNASASVTIDIAKAPQTLSWTPPRGIVYGTPLSSAQLNATASVVGPAAAGSLVYTPAPGAALDAGLGQTLTVTAQSTPNYESATLSVAIDVNRALLSLTVDARSKLYGSPVPALTGTLTGLVNGDNVTPSYATTGTQQGAAGTYPITGSLIDSANRLANYSVTITPSTLTVLPAPLTIVADSMSQQYSDPLAQFTASYTGLVLGESPAVLSGALSFSTIVTPATAPGQYPLAISGLASPNYAIQFVPGTVTVGAEDARVYFTGTVAAAPLNSTATTVYLTLSATIKDISATPDAAGDTFEGDIRNATVTFVDRGNGVTLCTAPVGLVTSDDTTVGTLTCTATAPLTNVTVGIVVSNYYIRDAANDDTVITITNFSSMSAQGAGKLTLTHPVGALGAAGWEASFTLNAAARSGGNEDGNPGFSLDIKGTGGQRYRITSTAVRNLVADKAANSGSVDVAALIEDLSTNKKVVLDSDAPARVTFTDSDHGNNPPGSIAITIWKKTGGLWFVSNFDGTRAIEQTFGNGEIKVR